MSSDELTFEEERVLNVAAVCGAALRSWEESARRTPIPPEFIESAEDLLLSLGDPEFPWRPHTSRLLAEATAFARMAESNLDQHGAIINLGNPNTFLDSLRRLLEGVKTLEEDAPEAPGPIVSALPSLAELSRGNATSKFVAQCFGWFREDGKLDEQRGMRALVDFRMGRPVRHPTQVRFAPPEASGLVRHPGLIQFVADALLRRREQSVPACLKTWEAEETEAPAGDVRPVEIPYPPAPRGRPAP